MIERKSVVDQIEITRAGTVQVRIGLILVDDGKEIDCKWHRTVISPGGDVAAQMAAVNAHLAVLGMPPVDAADISRVRAHVELNGQHHAQLQSSQG